MNKVVKRSKKRSTGGFTLTELMVASAIFVILMSALATLFNAAVSATRQGYASIEVNDTARAATNTITRDLTVAFTAREHGDVYNFYGRPDGFMFVGGLEGGNLGRISYVFHEEAALPPIVTTVVERWGDVVDNVARQARRVGREMGLYDAALDTEVTDAVARLELHYGTHALDETVEFEVEIVRESLIRLEEAGANDLDTFNMYVKGGLGPVVNLDWSLTYVDPIDPTRDSPVGSLDPDNQRPQFQFLMGALDPTPLTAGDDLRDFYQQINVNGGWPHPVSGQLIPLRILGPQVFDQMLKARKREFWLRMLSDDLGIFTPVDLQRDPTEGSTGYWYDEGFRVPNNRNQRNLNAHVLATGIIGSVSVRIPGTTNLIEAVPGTFPALGKFVAMDLLDAEPRFAYGDAYTEEDQSLADGLDNDGDGFIDEADELRTQATYLHYFNDLENLRDPKGPDDVNPDSGGPGNIPAMLLSGNPIVEQELLPLDMILADNVLGNRSSAKNLGSPLLPRIPSVVTVDFWVTRAKTRSGAPDFRQRFTQSIPVPAAHGRAVTSTIALGPGASL